MTRILKKRGMGAGRVEEERETTKKYGQKRKRQKKAIRERVAKKKDGPGGPSRQSEPSSSTISRGTSKYASWTFMNSSATT